MAEYIERSAAIREIEQINPVDYGAMWDYEAHHWAGECLRDCKEAIDSIPAADVAPVVRCKGCKHLVAVNVNGKGIPTCRVSGMEVAPDEFCSRGEKGRR